MSAPGDLASWGSRALATLLDWLIGSAMVAAAAGALTLGLSLAAGLDDREAFFNDLILPLWVLWVFFYYPLTMRRAGAHNGQSWAKQLLRIRVVREDGYAFDAKTAVLREFGIKNTILWTFSICLLYIPALLDALWPLWDQRNQSLHDKVLSTLVMKTSAPWPPVERHLQDGS